jgi:ubiquinone/menaquinone biosynthesis C-methylase UbiE
MPKVDPKKLWFNTPDSFSLCRMGGNGPAHPSQMYAIRKYVKPDESFLDYGCGSGTTYEAIVKEYGKMPYRYIGMDIIPKNIEWCKQTFPEGDWKVNSLIHEIDMPDKTYDVVYSRHVVDHMESFEKAMDEHCRVAKRLVIVILWVPFKEEGEHDIQHIIDQRGLPTEKTYLDEYTNRYSREKVMEWINEKKGWKLVELAEEIKNEDGSSAKHDTVIVLEYEKDTDY